MALRFPLATLMLLLSSGHGVAQPNPIWWNGFEFCPTVVVLYPDDDLDGWGATDYPLQTCGPAPIGFSPWPGDCNDADPDAWPGAPEPCDGVDNNCDGAIDEGFKPVACYDGPGGTAGVGMCSAGTRICKGAAGLSCQGQVLPAPEACDGLDNDCDGMVDEDMPAVPCYDGPPGTEGVGACSAGLSVCGGPGGLSCQGQVLPSPEILDGQDNDCDGKVDEDFEQNCDDGVDNDGDGLIDCGDPDCASSPACRTVGRAGSP